MGEDVATHGGKGASTPVPAAPDGIGALRSASWTDLCSRSRELADMLLVIGALTAAIGVTVGLAAAFPRHGDAILITGTVGAGVVGTAVLVGAALVNSRGERVKLLVLRVPPSATWVGAEAAAYRIGARTHVVRYEDVGEVRNDINIDFDTRPNAIVGREMSTYRFAMRVTGRDGKTICSWRAPLRGDATSDEQLAQVPSAHPIHFALAMSKAWEDWRTRNSLPI